jgi:hypothetical protein
MEQKTQRSIGEVLATLEAQAAFHREREAFYAEREAHFREHRTVHAAELQEILRRLEAFRSAAAEALDLADREDAAPPEQSLTKKDFGFRSRPKIHLLLETIIAEMGADEPFGPLGLTAEMNRRFGERLRRRVKAGHVSTALKRLAQKGIVRLVQKGRPHSEALYVREVAE